MEEKKENIEPKLDSERIVKDSVKDYDTLVLSGGGAKGFCLLGAVQAVIDLELGKNIKNYVGTSIGSILCYLFSIGYTPIEIIVSLHTNKWLEKLHNFNILEGVNGNGVTSFSNIQEALEKLTINKIGKFITLGKLKEIYGKTLICVTYNMTTCSTEYLGPENYPDLPCITALRMSSNIPLVFDRFKYLDNFYIDGGISDNFAIKKGEELGEKVIGIYINISEKSLKDNPEDGVINYFLKLLQIPILHSTKYKSSITDKGKCTIVPVDTEDLKNFIHFSIKSKDRLDMFSVGYSNVMHILKTN
jgi:predicted acylesterase/phospholipase RssA